MLLEAAAVASRTDPAGSVGPQFPGGECRERRVWYDHGKKEGPGDSFGCPLHGGSRRALRGSGKRRYFSQRYRADSAGTVPGVPPPGRSGPHVSADVPGGSPLGQAIREAVVIRKMPPWFADPKHGSFS